MRNKEYFKFLIHYSNACRSHSQTGSSWEIVIPSGSPVTVAGTKVVGPSSTAFEAYKQEAKLEVQRSHNSNQHTIWNEEITGRGLSHGPAMPAKLLFEGAFMGSQCL